jgi:hypothetical protein
LPHMHGRGQDKTKQVEGYASNHGVTEHTTAHDKRDTDSRLEFTHCGLTLSWLGPSTASCSIIGVNAWPVKESLMEDAVRSQLHLDIY